MYGFVPPDLDDLQRAELMDLRKILARMVDYCDNRITLLGGMGDSDLCKTRMAEIYASLPQWAQWGSRKNPREPFTPEARQALVNAQNEAVGLGSSAIGTIHLLLGLLPVLGLQQLDVEGLRREARSVTLGGGDGSPATFSPGAKKAIEAAFDEARAAQATRITPHHMLAALARGEGRAAAVLLGVGLNPEVIRGLR